ncbi:MAG: ABC transporter ATP-binding protein [Ignavibacteriales bacterium]|nr:ABC transporter ATP-binding protein [Ignavibacteriales bacterium]
MIEANHLAKVYGKTTVLDIPVLKIAKGESFGLVGNNGAGKTTFFSLVLDIIKATEGSVRSKEHEVKLSDHWKKYTGSYLDESFIIDFLLPEEYFEFIGGLHGFTKDDVKLKIQQYADFFNGEILGKKKFIREMSKGNQKKVGIVGSLLPDPEVVILDEPFPHLDPSSVIRLKRILKELNDKGATLLISSHDLNHVTEVCKRIVLLDRGKIIKDIKTGEDTLKELENYFAVNAD